MPIRNNLKQILDEKGIKQIWLAEKVGVNKSTISNIINNRYSTTIELAFNIAKVLNVDVSDIFYMEEND